MARIEQLTIRSGAVALKVTSYGAGHPVLLLHAGLERRTVWQPVAEGLARSGYRAIAMDQRGHGDSDRVARYRLDDFAGDVQQLTAHLGVSRLVIAGASLGGFAALLAAADNQAGIAGLALIDVVPAPDPTRTRHHVAGIATAIQATDDRVMCGQLVDDILARSATLRHAARRLRIPTLLVRGAKSPSIGSPELTQFLTDVPHARVRTVPRAGHLVAREQPQRLLHILTSFLAEPAVSFRLAESV